MIKKVFKEKSHSIIIQFFRYSIVGGIAWLVDYGTFLLFTDIFHVYVYVSNVIAFCTGLLTNYILSIIWVFPVQPFKNKFLEFIIFGVIGVIGLGLISLFLWFFHDVLSIDHRIAKIMATIPVLLWNFLARRYVLFYRIHKENKESDSPGIS